ncbi:8409_t:CDS:1 [Gigaspora margarita]|uniref:8409_t:CDS:1 n=1 Tax=Gigaspora margarita TaxID=4874 RepID=A0ABN7W0B5_GIGMA|nr:8409_t:CDS:1 [Gigaspora margarita]
MSDEIRYSSYFVVSGLLVHSYDANILAKSYHGDNELMGSDVMCLVVKLECHKNNIRNQRMIKKISTYIWENYATINVRARFNDLAEQINRIRIHMPDMEHTLLSTTIFNGIAFG